MFNCTYACTEILYPEFYVMNFYDIIHEMQESAEKIALKTNKEHHWKAIQRFSRLYPCVGAEGYYFIR